LPDTTIELTGGKQPLNLTNPVMVAAGTVGFAGEYARLFDMSKLGAMVTNPITWRPRRAASGSRVVPLDSGLLVHTGLPNPGAARVFRDYAAYWKNSPCPVIVHIAGTSPDEVIRCAKLFDARDGIVAIEIGINDSAAHRDVLLMISAAVGATELPILARLPLYTAPALAASAQEAGAGAIVVAAPPRGTARDPLSGQLIGGRLYGPWIKPLALRAVGQIAKTVTIPVIGCGGIHSPDDARDFLAAGAKAVQLDSVTWIRPDMTEIIARNLGGLEMTRVMGSLADEWQPGLGETAMRARWVASPPMPPDVT